MRAAEAGDEPTDLTTSSKTEGECHMWEDFLLFVAIGFAAQMIDGAAGMAYGLTSTSVLLGFGMPPATASASVHAAEVFTTGLSGAAHWRLGNVQWSVVLRLAIPGMIGGALGAYVLTSVPVDTIKPVISTYLFLMAGWIIWKALRVPIEDQREPTHWLVPLGLAGGFLDASGGGGWGPMVTSTLLGTGTKARYTIGSVNAAEFFVTCYLAGIPRDDWTGALAHHNRTYSRWRNCRAARGLCCKERSR